MDSWEVINLWRESGGHLAVYIGRHIFLFSYGTLYPFQTHDLVVQTKWQILPSKSARRDGKKSSSPVHASIVQKSTRRVWPCMGRKEWKINVDLRVTRCKSPAIEGGIPFSCCPDDRAYWRWEHGTLVDQCQSRPPSFQRLAYPFLQGVPLRLPSPFFPVLMDIMNMKDTLLLRALMLHDEEQVRYVKVSYDLEVRLQEHTKAYNER